MKHELTLFKSLNYNQYIILMKMNKIEKNLDNKFYKRNYFW